MTIKVQEQVWGRWIPARECCHLRVSNQAVAAKQRNNQSYKGWLFQTRFGDTIAARKSIANGFTDAELPVPMNGFDQKKRPAGAGKDSKYLHVPLQDIDLVNSEVSFLYLPPTVEGEDVITVELYRNGMNGQPPQLLQVTTNRVKIVAEYTH